MREAKVIEVQEIVFDDRQKAEEALAQLQAEGADFAAVAKKYVKDGAVWCSWSAMEAERV